MHSNVETVEKFIVSWSKLNSDELIDYFCKDAIYHNMPAKPVQGHDKLKLFIQGFIKDWNSTNWEILNIIGEGDLVFAERLDRTVVGEVIIDLPCCGVFEMEDGKIKIWRDYFDMKTFTASLS